MDVNLTDLRRGIVMKIDLAISGETKLTGLVGGSGITSSFSPRMHTASFAEVGVDAVYLSFPIAPEMLSEVVQGLQDIAVGYNENAEEPILFDLSHMGSTKECEQNLLNDTLDIAFCGNPAKPNELNWIPLFPENAIVAVSSSHPLAKMQSVSLADLRNYKQLSYREPSYMYYAFCGMFKKYNLSPQPAFEDEISALSATCVNPDAVTIMLDTVRDVAWDSIKLLSIKEFQRPYHWIGMAFRDKSSYETNIQAFISQMESLSESMSWVSPIENDFLEDW